MEPAPSEVRKRILEDHRALRGVLDRLEALARGRLQGRESVSDELLAQARVLDQRLRKHMDLEEHILVPALRRADAWGPERVERFHAEHQRQRQRQIMTAVQAAAERPLVEFALIAWGFVHMLRDVPVSPQPETD